MSSIVVVGGPVVCLVRCCAVIGAEGAQLGKDEEGG